MRGPILAAASIHALAVFAVQIREVIEGEASTLSQVATLSLMTLALLSLAPFGRAEPELFGAARRPQGETAPVARGDRAGHLERGQFPAGRPDADIVLTAEDRPVVWSLGAVYDPDDARTYSGEIRLRNGGLELQGCALGMFCQTQLWRRPKDILRSLETAN